MYVCLLLSGQGAQNLVHVFCFSKTSRLQECGDLKLNSVFAGTISETENLLDIKFSNSIFKASVSGFKKRCRQIFKFYKF